MSEKKYFAMYAVFDVVKDEHGQKVVETVKRDRPDGSQYVYQKYKYAKTGEFKPFGTNGKVCSVYDSEAKAKRYAGKDGYVAEVDLDDARRLGVDLTAQLIHCENRMLFWAAEADRINKELKS